MELIEEFTSEHEELSEIEEIIRIVIEENTVEEEIVEVLEEEYEFEE